MSEAKLQAAIVKALKKAGVWVIRTAVNQRNGSRRGQSGEPGMPDLYMPSLGHLEIKLPGEKLNADQVAWHARAARLGVRVGTATTLLEALQIATLWQIDAGQRGARIRPKYIRVVK